ncbi:hypothetical protein [Tautonia rosea]|uniref:hypothetical protein n=1 Tax=Tautonia rosea TaxID=2728037 RepID=UPI0014758A10|nr:hypothetical protein [Tautonia rosea]
MPFRVRSLVESFQADPRWWYRAAAAGGLGLVLAIRIVWQGRGDLSTIEMVATLIAIPGGFLLAGLLLSSSDEIRAAIAADRRVS